MEIDKENDPNLLMRLGYYIKKARKLKGLTQDDLAERIRSGRQYILNSRGIITMKGGEH